jgi:hypothetical protein
MEVEMVLRRTNVNGIRGEKEGVERKQVSAALF